MSIHAGMTEIALYADRKRRGELDKAMLGDSGYQRIANEAYFTPPENLDVLMTYLRPAAGDIWEPACGDGALAKRLIELGYSVISTDLIDYGYAAAGTGLDFFTTVNMAPGCRSIISNPPYDKAEEFVRHALKMAEPVNGQVAMFLRNEFDCGKKRMELFTKPPFAAKIIVTKRPRWIKESSGSPRHNFAWYIWDWRMTKGHPTILYMHPDQATPKPFGSLLQ